MHGIPSDVLFSCSMFFLDQVSGSAFALFLTGS